MLLVKTRLNISKVHGIGLFAGEFIPKGTITWKYSSEFDTSYPLDSIDRMSPSVRERFLDYSYVDFKQNKYILCFDDQRFINHSNKPNIKSTPDKDIALRNIKEGEEMTCNYEDYEKDWFERRKIDKLSFRSISYKE